MMPKYRVWDEYTGRIHDVVGFDFIENEVHYENYAEAEALIHARDFKDVELMQSTGLKDVHGVEIYEGDIVQDCYSREVSFIEFKEGAFYITFSNVTELLSENDDIIEIVGNIFENEMLLEVMR
ncbi:YopX family protein [Staphylococcus aureus]|uniref:YopX family protein n=2 Tax=Staphylococcus aureus TaxID=1280 RepID=UPI000B95AFF4|nr:YopX family protein [Staphylococcus aureus]MCQ9892607.1 YopX family protein [Staphylococcus aureus]MCQ9912781.1 YopX family protein [Staphylococcus aureus]MCT6528001.1 YopX family protein [Staphylococcus aureus]MCT6554340.1 YopX family protein [Staphylococcus aureus]MEA1217558.1 YopX family protein [Staphylococcus aureus]